MFKKYHTIFVEDIPESIKEGIVYYSDKKQRSVHLCPCNCGEQVWLSHYSYGWKHSFNENNDITIITPISNTNCGMIYTFHQGYSFDMRG